MYSVIVWRTIFFIKSLSSVFLYKLWQQLAGFFLHMASLFIIMTEFQRQCSIMLIQISFDKPWITTVHMPRKTIWLRLSYVSEISVNKSVEFKMVWNPVGEKLNRQYNHYGLDVVKKCNSLYSMWPNSEEYNHAWEVSV